MGAVRGDGPGPLVHPAGQGEPLLELEAGVAVCLPDLLLMIPVGLLLPVSLHLIRVLAELFGDVVNDGRRDAGRVGQEGGEDRSPSRRSGVIRSHSAAISGRARWAR